MNDKHLRKKLFELLAVLIGISIVAFILGVVSPGDPAELALSRGGNYAPSEEQIASMREAMGLNRPLSVQYLDWLGNILTGDFGRSFSSNRPVLEVILERLPVTLSLALMGFLATLILGTLLGTLSAYYRERRLDYILSTLSNIALSIPGFWLALVLILVCSEILGILPTSGLGSYKHWIMPTIVISLPTIAMTQRLMRASMLAEYSKLYYRMGISRGVSKAKMTLVELLPNALVSIIPMLGNYLGGILGGAAIIEAIFSLPGMGSLAIEAIKMKDFPMIQAYVLMSGGIFVGVTIAVDVIIPVIYPKIGSME